MSIDRERCIRALSDIGAHPTASFYEARVAAYILGELERLGLPYQQDEYGNIVASYGDSSTKPLAIISHMDHPGFEVVDSTHGRLLGHVRKECFERPVKVRVFPALPPGHALRITHHASRELDEGIPGVIVGVEGSGDEGLLFDLELDSAPPENSFGVWDLPRFELKGDLAYMRAIDDVVGCAAILLALEEMIVRKSPCRCLGVFTRAEEAGFIGAAPLAQEKIIPHDAVVVSLEMSKALPGAEIGGGPVIRVGDFERTFDDSAESILRAAWASLKKENSEVKVQRQLMSGGRCEAGVFMLEGYLTTAMALPLGNYHNMGEDMTIQPEYIHLDDLATCVEMLVRSAELTDTDPTPGFRERYQSKAEKFKDRLKGA